MARASEDGLEIQRKMMGIYKKYNIQNFENSYLEEVCSAFVTCLEAGVTCAEVQAGELQTSVEAG